MSVLYFLLLVGVLVVIHELGHFAAAKLLDVKVLRFSFGYGRPLVRAKIGETEYQVAVFPLGGYVRILGIEGECDRRRPTPAASFASRPLWQRVVIVLAGPAANLVLPVVIYFVFFAGHTMLPAARDRRRARWRRRRARRASSPAIGCSRSTAAPFATGRRSSKSCSTSPGKELQLADLAQRQGVRALHHAARGHRAPARRPGRRSRAASASRTRRSCRSSA